MLISIFGIRRYVIVLGNMWMLWLLRKCFGLGKFFNSKKVYVEFLFILI